MATRNFVPRSGSQGQLGTTAKPWDKVIAITGSFTAFSGSVTGHELTLISGSINSTGSFGLIKEHGLNLNERFSRNTHEAFELDENGDFIPTPSTGYMIDPKWELDENGDLQRRERELWTFDWDDYFSD